MRLAVARQRFFVSGQGVPIFGSSNDVFLP
jgi:hypothetical protein